MSHKADESFFDYKRQHSRYKDLILGYYLKPYLEKVKIINRPIVLADLFAGPGKFEDGSEGSPLILLNAAKRISDTGRPIRVLLCEKNPALHAKLVRNTDAFANLADIRNCDCNVIVDELAAVARTSTLLLYIDPFSVFRVDYRDMGRVYSAISEGSSVEVLMILMASVFVRWARAYVKAEDAAAPLEDKLVVQEDGTIDEAMLMAIWDENRIRATRYVISSGLLLDAFAGGDFWRKIAREPTTFAEQVEKFVEEYVRRLRQWFKVSLAYGIPEGAQERIPAYSIVFGSRFEPSIDLINDAMVKARRSQQAQWESETLFATALPPLSAPTGTISERLLAALRIKAARWGDLRRQLCVDTPGSFSKSEIDAEIKRLLQRGAISGDSGERINDPAMLKIASA